MLTIQALRKGRLLCFTAISGIKLFGNFQLCGSDVVWVYGGDGYFRFCFLSAF